MHLALPSVTLIYLLLNLRRQERREWVVSSSWQDGEAAVRRRPTRERQVTNTLLPGYAIKLPAAQAEEGPMAGDGKKLIRNAAAEFLIFTGQASPQCVEA